MKNIIAIVIAAVSLTGCRPTEEAVVKAQSSELSYPMGRITLHKHPSGLCFAALSDNGLGSTARSITNIPCVSGDTVFVR